MRVSIDLDGCLWQHMSFFRVLMHGLKMQGHEVGILTLHKRSGMENDLALLMARGFPEPNFYIGVPEEGVDVSGMAFKAQMIRECQIDWHFDDFDFNNPTSEKAFSEFEEMARVFKVQSREPYNEHFE